MRNPRAVARMILADIIGLRVGGSVTYRAEDVEAAFYGAAPRLAGTPIPTVIQAGLPGPEIGRWTVEAHRGGQTYRIRRDAGPRARLRDPAGLSA